MLARLARAALVVAAIAALFGATACDVQSNQAGGGGGNKTKALKVGWSTIYLTPSWMQQTQTMLQADVDRLTKAGKVASYQTFNANGDTSQQIAQIQAMIQQQYDVILVDAGSSTALNPVLERAVGQGITVINFDSLVTSNKVIKVNTDQHEWGRMLGQWLADKIGGKGEIIAMNGPAGVAVAEDRWAGAQEVFAKYPGIKIDANVNSEYNLAPAAQAFASAYSAHPGIVGVFSQGGTLSEAALRTIVQQNGKIVPITGENYNGFLKLWQQELPKGFSSLSTAQPNYLAVIALEAGVAKAGGTAVHQDITVPLPKIDDSNVGQWVKADQGDDSYAITPMAQADIDRLIRA
jgi:ribose transport system substrate-binding protein